MGYHDQQGSDRGFSPGGGAAAIGKHTPILGRIGSYFRNF